MDVPKTGICSIWGIEWGIYGIMALVVEGFEMRFTGTCFNARRFIGFSLNLVQQVSHHF